MLNKIDLSEDLIATPFKNGVRLIRPEETLCDPYLSLKELFSCNINVFFLGSDSNNILKFNEHCAYTCPPLNYHSKQVANLKMENIFRKEGVLKIIQEGLSVCTEKRMKIFEEEVMRLDEIDFRMMAVKLPLYVTNDKIAAILGFSMVTDNTLFPRSATLTEGFSLLMQTGLLQSPNRNSFLPGRKIGEIYVSKQELKCLQLTIRGMTAKNVAQYLKLSHRTVEEYLNNLKMKFRVHSKSELIEKVVSHIEKQSS